MSGTEVNAHVTKIMLKNTEQLPQKALAFLWHATRKTKFLPCFMMIVIVSIIWVTVKLGLSFIIGDIVEIAEKNEHLSCKQ